MVKIPVTFILKGAHYTGALDDVAGAGGNVWHLMVNNFYCGRLRRAEDAWYFDENKFGGGELVDYFAQVVVAWYG
jgi:hypothetical protein